MFSRNERDRKFGRPFSEARRSLLINSARVAGGIAAAAVLVELPILGDANPKKEKKKKKKEKLGSYDIPEEYLNLYKSAAASVSIDWAYLAGIGKKESDHGQAKLPGVTDGLNEPAKCCAGPMQFNITNGPPSTWDTYGGDYNYDGDPNVHDPRDAIPAAAKKLYTDGINDDVEKALRRYNDDGVYVQGVIDWATIYRERYP